MSAIRIAKGYPISFLITVNNDTTMVDVNDGTWTYDVSLHYQTYDGPTPFDLITTPSGSQIQVNLDNTQTNQLNHLGTGYVLVISCSKNDNSVFIENKLAVSVTNGL